MLRGSKGVGVLRAIRAAQGPPPYLSTRPPGRKKVPLPQIEDVSSISRRVSRTSGARRAYDGPMPGPERRLAAILSADVVGSAPQRRVWQRVRVKLRRNGK